MIPRQTRHHFSISCSTPPAKKHTSESSTTMGCQRCSTVIQVDLMDRRRPPLLCRGCLGSSDSASEHHLYGQLFSSQGRPTSRAYSELLTTNSSCDEPARRLQELQYNSMIHMLLSYRIIHSIPNVQVLLHTINIPPTLRWIRLQELPNLCQVLS